MKSFYRKVVEAGIGIRYAARERHFQVHLLAALVVLGLGAILSLSRIEWAVLVLIAGWVLTTEMMNTIVEHIIDVFKPEFHEYAKILKQLASGAVLVAALVAAVIGCFIFIPHLLGMLEQF